MHKKRDRIVVLYLHRSSKNVLLFPYVCHMAGEAAAFGDAVELVAPPEPATIGKQALRLLRAAKKADFEVMKRRRIEQLRRYWRGEPNASEVVQGETWNQLMMRYPALTKGPGTYMRQFSVCRLVERDGWKYRKVVRERRSESRGCVRETDSRRVAISEGPTELGMQIRKLLSE